MLASDHCRYRCWNLEPVQKLSGTRKSWRKPLRWLVTQKRHSDYRWSDKTTRLQAAKMFR